MVLQDVIRPGTRRGLDFVVLEELRKRTGIMPNEVLKFALAEMLCNALDTDSSIIEVDVNVEKDFTRLQVRDNGSKRLTLEDIKLILDFENKASSKRGFLRVSRGYLGNALKCIFGYCYALAIEKGLSPPEILVESGPNRYTINLKVDRINEAIDSDVQVSNCGDIAGNTFTVKIPTVESEFRKTQILRDIVFATSMVNPTRLIRYFYYDATNGFYEKPSFGSSENSSPIRQETNVLWYTKKEFDSLFKDFLRVKPDTKLSEFMALFRGFTGKKVIREILQKLNASNHDSETTSSVQFFPATPMSELALNMVASLYKILKDMSKSISKRSIPSVLGYVGEKQLEAFRDRQKWKRLRYTMIPAFRIQCSKSFMCYTRDCGKCKEDHEEIPYLIELAVFDRDESDTEGLKVYQCVNFMASMEDIFSRIFDVKYRLGLVGIKADMPVTVMLHLVCPVLKWLNYGKSGLDE